MEKDKLRAYLQQKKNHIKGAYFDVKAARIFGINRLVNRRMSKLALSTYDLEFYYVTYIVSKLYIIRLHLLVYEKYK